jgi:two-component system, NarL family, sensor kinase
MKKIVPKTYTLFIIFLLGNMYCLAQHSYFDSLRSQLLQKARTDSFIYCFDSWLPIGIQINHDSIEQDLKIYKTMAANANRPFADAVFKIHYAFWYSQKTGNYQKGLEMAMEAKNIFEKENAKPQLVNAFCRIAFFKLWNEIGQETTAKNESVLSDYLLPALQMAIDINDTTLMITSYQWLGSYYNVSKNNQPKAIEYFSKAEKLFSNRRNPLLQLVTLASMGITYANACDEKNMLAYAEKYKQNNYSSQYLYGLSNMYRAMANYFIKCKTNEPLALQYALQSYDMARQQNAPEYINLSERRLYEIYKQMGDTKHAMQYLELSQQSESKIARNKFDFAYTAYDVQNKEQQIAQQQLKLQQKNLYILLALASLFMMAIIGFVFLKVRKKNLLIQIKELEQKQQLQLDVAVRETEEEERKRIASNLHDSVVQKLVVAKMNIETLQKKEIDNKNINIVNHIFQLIEESTIEIRRISHTIMPASFEKEGLGKIVKEFANKVIVDGIRIEVFEHGNFLLLPKNSAIVAYRIIQECVQNACKHAYAQTISISLAIDNNTLDISVEDDGLGFEPSAIIHSGIGLQAIKNRVEQLQGHFSIESQLQKGTIVFVHLPILIQ